MFTAVVEKRGKTKLRKTDYLREPLNAPNKKKKKGNTDFFFSTRKNKNSKPINPAKKLFKLKKPIPHMCARAFQKKKKKK